MAWAGLVLDLGREAVNPPDYQEQKSKYITSCVIFDC